MKCAHPLKAFYLGQNANGKGDYKVTGFDVYCLVKDKKGDYVCVSQARAKNIPDKEKIKEYIEIPCGRCIYCRLRYSKNWADRCLLEAQYHDENYFLTLTYDDEHLPSSEVYNPETGEAITTHSLVKKDLQDFWKRLRKDHKTVRYFAAGEYGDRTCRPHYHAIVFGLQLLDLVSYKSSPQGMKYYTSEYLNSKWKNGFVVVGQADWSAIAYTARYVTKKLYGTAARYYEAMNIIPEFAVMSRRPGIGLRYYEDHPNIMDCNRICVPTFDGGKSFGVPRYFRQKYDEVFEKTFEEQEVSRHEVMDQQKAIREILQSQTDLSYLDLLNVAEQDKIATTKVLKRSYDHET